jgi:hypothetical protein
MVPPPLVTVFIAFPSTVLLTRDKTVAVAELAASRPMLLSVTIELETLAVAVADALAAKAEIPLPVAAGLLPEATHLSTLISAAPRRVALGKNPVSGVVSRETPF